MPRAPDQRMDTAKAMYLSGHKLVDIANQLDIPDGTVRRWKSTYNWEIERPEHHSERSEKDSERSKKKPNVQKAEKKATAEEVRHVMENPELTDKQRLFCLHYIRCFNATKSYQKAYGVDYSTAASIGYRLLEYDGVRKEIARLKQGRLNREMLDASDIYQRYMDIAFADITDYVDFGRETVQVMGPFGPIEVEDSKTGEKIPLTKEVNSVRFRESSNVDGSLITEVKQGKDGASIKLANGMKALDWLTEHMDMANDEQRARVEHIRARTAILKGTDNVEGLEKLDKVLEEIKGVV